MLFPVNLARTFPIEALVKWYLLPQITGLLLKPCLVGSDSIRRTIKCVVKLSYLVFHTNQDILAAHQ